MLGENFPGTLDAARAGAEWAWAAIYRDLAPAVVGYLRARRANEPDDLAGEVFLQVVRDLPRFQGGEREFGAWVFVTGIGTMSKAEPFSPHTSFPSSTWRQKATGR